MSDSSSIDSAEPETRLARLLKAARALAGYSVEDLAQVLDRKGLGVGPLKAMEQGRRRPEVGELAAIATACRVDPDFFWRRFTKGDTLGQRIRRLRELHGADVPHLAYQMLRWGYRNPGELPWEDEPDDAQAADLEDAIVRWERDEEEPPPRELQALATLFRISVDDLSATTDKSARTIKELENRARRLAARVEELTAENERSRHLADTLAGVARSASDALERTQVERARETLDAIRVMKADLQARIRAAEQLGREDDAATAREWLAAVNAEEAVALADWKRTVERSGTGPAADAEPA